MNWKTTIAGCALAAVTAIQLVVQQGRSVEDWKTWIVPAAMAVFGFLAKDAHK